MSEGRIMRALASIALGILASACGGSAGNSAEANGPGPEWDAAFWNPKPADGDITIDGPCGARFVFRRVETPTDANWLADVPVTLGQGSGSDESALQAIMEQVRHGSLVGGFSQDDDPSKRFYYLSKYEITADQFDAVMKAGCPTPSQERTIPVEMVSSFDANTFARKLSEFGFTNADARKKLPTSSGEPAYVRLPTEAEWEFAARGGASVSVEDRLAATYPMDADTTQFEWFASDDSCRGSLQPVGFLRPNPLGIHDMLGNVSEIVAEPFRVNRGGSLHGQAGGVTARGGSCATPLAELRSSSRTEFPDYDTSTGKPNAPAMTGFRLALGTPVAPTNQRLELLEKGWDNLRELRSGEDDPSADLRKIAAGLSDPRLAQAITQAASQFDNEMTQRAQIEASTARNTVANGAMLIRNYRLVMNDISARERALVELRKTNPEIAKAQEIALEAAKGVAAMTRDLYTQIVVGAADNYPVRVLEDAVGQVSKDLRTRYAQAEVAIPMADMACMFASQAKDFRDQRPSKFDDYLARVATATPQEFRAACG